MSNQVYSNNQSKYYDFPGFNMYSPISAIACPTATPKLINFGSNTLFDFNPNVVSFDGSGNITINRSGMYSIQFNISVSADAANPQNAVECISYISLNRVNVSSNLQIAYLDLFYPGQASEAGFPNTKSFILSYVGFFYNGDIISPFVNNLESSGLSVETNSNFIISQIY